MANSSENPHSIPTEPNPFNLYTLVPTELPPYKSSDVDEEELYIRRYKEWSNDLYCLCGSGFIIGSLGGFGFGIASAASQTPTPTPYLSSILRSSLQTSKRFGCRFGVAGLIYPSFEIGVGVLTTGTDRYVPGLQQGNLIVASAGFCTGASYRAVPPLFTKSSMPGPRGIVMAGVVGAVAALVGIPFTSALRGPI